MPRFAPAVAAEPAAAEMAPQLGDDHLLMLQVGEVCLRLKPAAAPERVGALVAGLRVG